MKAAHAFGKVLPVVTSVALACSLAPMLVFADDADTSASADYEQEWVEEGAGSASAADEAGGTGEAASGSADSPDADVADSSRDSQVPSGSAAPAGGGSSVGAQAAADDGDTATATGATERSGGAAAGRSGESAIATQATGDSTSSTSSASTDSSSSSASESSSSHKPSVAGAHTISWANTSADAKEWFGDELAVLPNGTAELVSVKLASGTTLKKADIPAKAGSDGVSFDKGVLDAPAGSTITMKLLPARGYQLLSTTINDSITVTPSSDDAEVGVYSFAMPSQGVALDCGFMASKDAVESECDEVKSGTIADADDTVAAGTLLLSITDTDDDGEKGLKDAAKKLGASDSDVVACFDMTLENIVNQGAADSSWDTELTDLSSAVSLTLTLSDAAAKDASAFYIVREHGGAYQQAAVDYDAATKTISFKSNAFSDYAIVKGAPSTSGTGSASTASGSSGSTTPKTGDANDPAPFAATAAASALIAAFSARRIRQANR